MKKIKCLVFLFWWKMNCLAWLVEYLICFWLITNLTLIFVWLIFHHISFPLMSCLHHFVMSSPLLCPLLIGWVTSSPLISLINFLIVCLMTADMLYGSLNFRFRSSFEGSYPGSYYLGSLNLSQYIIFLFFILSYNPLIWILFILLPYTQFFPYLVDFREKSKCSELDSDDLYIHLYTT